MMDHLRRLFWCSAVYNFRLKVFHVPGKLNVVADHASRLHEPTHLRAFMEYLVAKYGPITLNRAFMEYLVAKYGPITLSSSATSHMSLETYAFLMGWYGSGEFLHSDF